MYITCYRVEGLPAVNFHFLRSSLLGLTRPFDFVIITKGPCEIKLLLSDPKLVILGEYDNDRNLEDAR